MGQTLTHGVYLPSEGERNCYSGLASNWRLLDGAIGTVAAHTTAIAGKADISHTHGNITNDGKVGTDANKPLITGTDGVIQAGSFGTSANTFCEGNDSRLSDARTPVAHTHTKLDVTDLLNSNFIPSVNNTYDLGSSSYQWNNLYAKNYYYNGTQWGLDQNNTWTGTNTFTAANLYHTAENPANILKSSTMQEGVVPSGNRTAYTGNWLDKNANNLGYSKFTFYSTVSIQTYEINLRNKATNGFFSPSGSQIQSGFQLALYPNGNSELKIYAHTLPNGNGTWSLGDSTHKWKTLNGVNPGALSLPGAYQGINEQIKNPSDQLNAIDLNGGSNTWVSDVDCYLYFYIPNNKFTWIRIFWPATLVRCGQTFVPVPNESSDYSGFVPVPANTTVVIQIKGTQAPTFRRSACLGNV